PHGCGRELATRQALERRTVRLRTSRCLLSRGAWPDRTPRHAGRCGGAPARSARADRAAIRPRTPPRERRSRVSWLDAPLIDDDLRDIPPDRSRKQRAEARRTVLLRSVEDDHHRELRMSRRHEPDERSRDVAAVAAVLRDARGAGLAGDLALVALDLRLEALGSSVVHHTDHHVREGPGRAGR